MDKEQPRRRVGGFIGDLVPDWRPSRDQWLWALRIVLVIAVVLGILTLVGLPFDVTLWDWLKLLVVPTVIAGGGIWFNRQQRERELENARQQREQELEIAEHRTQDEALQAYLDQMSSMLIPNTEQPSLYKARPGDSLSSVARARTLTVLSRLDGSRKGRVVQFLYESGLVSRGHKVIDLRGADLRDAYLRDADLRGATMNEAVLSGANLGGADLNGAGFYNANLGEAWLPKSSLGEAYLHKAFLSDANLFMANLSGANLSEAWLIGAMLRNAILRDADLRGAILIDTDLNEADLGGADLDDANLYNANLSGANLSEANLSEAMLQEANLSGADLSGADLNGASLSGADLSEAIGIGYERLERQANDLEGATMPNGEKYEDWLKRNK